MVLGERQAAIKLGHSSHLSLLSQEASRAGGVFVMGRMQVQRLVMPLLPALSAHFCLALQIQFEDHLRCNSEVQKKWKTLYSARCQPG
jgi:hypothetical protein